MIGRADILVVREIFFDVWLPALMIMYLLASQALNEMCIFLLVWRHVTYAEVNQGCQIGGPQSYKGSRK